MANRRVPRRDFKLGNPGFLELLQERMFGARGEGKAWSLRQYTWLGISVSSLSEDQVLRLRDNFSRRRSTFVIAKTFRPLVFEREQNISVPEQAGKMANK